MKDIPINEQVNIWREDVVVDGSMLSQEQALAGAEKKFEGYFAVPLIVDKEAS